VGDHDLHRKAAPADTADTLERMARSTPPGTRSLAEALQGHETLGALLGSWRTAQECMQAARPVIGAGLGTLLRPGPLENGCWVLLADSGPAASKARQLLPRIAAALQQRGLPVSEVKVRVSPRHAAPSSGRSAA
jgi:hypothetical protein